MARQARAQGAAALPPQYAPRAEFLEEHGEEILTVHQSPATHWKHLRSLNLLERLGQEPKRRTRVARIFPDEAACLRLISALAIQTNAARLQRACRRGEETKVSEEVTVEVVAAAKSLRAVPFAP